MLEIFSRKPQGIRLDEGRQVVPVKFDEGSTSLSAILLDDDYYQLILAQHNEEQNLPFANPAALIPLKAKAWLDLSARASQGEKVDKDDIAKHRGDVFRIAGTLPGEPGATLPAPIQEDLESFLAAFPIESNEWTAILDSLKTTFGSTKIKPSDLIAAIRIYFRLQ